MKPGGAVDDIHQLVRLYRGDVSVFKSASSRVAVVLGTQVLSGGRPSPPLAARARHAAALYLKGEVSTLVPTGGIGKYPPSEAAVISRILQGSGVPENAIVLEEEAHSTRESALILGDVLRERGVDRVRVVTDPLHCIRSVAAFRAAGINAEAEPVYSSPMWRVGRMRRGQFFREFGAVIWYRMRQRGGPASG